MRTDTAATERSLEWTRFASAVWFGWPATLPCGRAPIEELHATGLAGLVAVALRRAGDLRARDFERDRVRTKIRNTFALSELRRCFSRWRDAGVVALPIKGAALLLRHDGAAHDVRPMSDLDVLVTPDCYRRAREVLLDNGFVDRSSFRDPITAAVVNESSFDCKTSPVPFTIDLHRRFGAWPTLRPMGRHLARERETRADVLLPTPVATLMIAVAHRARDPVRRDARELIDMCDAMRRMGADEAHRARLYLEQMGLGRQFESCWLELNERLAPPLDELSAMRRELQTLNHFGCDGPPSWRPGGRDGPYSRWRLSAISRFGYGTSLELAAADCLYLGTRLGDRLFFRRGADRFARCGRVQGA